MSQRRYGRRASLRIRRTSARRGSTIVELLLSMVIALVVISSATAFSVSSWTARRSWTVRETVDRSARFIGMAIARDAQEAGVALESNPVFASIDASGDTLSVLSVPHEPEEAPVYTIWDDGVDEPFYPGTGNCGDYCIKFKKNAGAYTLQGGDLALLQVGSERRLVYLTSVAGDGANEFRVIVHPRTSMLSRAAGFSDDIKLARSGTTLQKLNAVAYWRDAGTKTLFRAQTFNSSGDPRGEPIAEGVEAFNVRLQFLDGGEERRYDGLDADTTNDGHQIVGVRVEATIKGDQVDPVKGGEPIRRHYEWRVAPRNLLYEKNR